MFKKIFFMTAMAAAGTFLSVSGVKAAESEELPAQITISNGGNSGAITDGSYSTTVNLNTGDTITVKTDTGIKGIYLIWDSPVNEWTLKYNGSETVQGSNGFLHDYIEFEGEVTEFTIYTDSSNLLADIYCYGEGELPSDVQVWEPECEKADILLLSSHADDEILFFGSILPEYAGERDLEVQVVYFSQYWTGAKIREHEKLDGLWHAGVKNYPYTGDFDDWYASSLEQAENLFGYDKTVEFVVEMLRKFKPQVTVAQDLNGEYGHGTHMLTAKAMTEAITLCGDASKYPESAEKYGTHEVKKTYLHLYGENKIKLTTREPLESFDGKTALEVAAESYKYHVSQQWCWFYVDDEYEYSCADFGLYYSAVGIDTGNDMMENIVDYKTQDEELRKQEEESRRQEEESKRLEEESKSREAAIEESISIAEAKELKSKEQSKENALKVIKILVIVVIVLAVIFGIAVFVLKRKQHKKRRHRKIK